jgi:hypothetical protein
MTVIKDWIAEAAKELASHFSFGVGRDNYVTDEQRQGVANHYASIISKHCPLKPDTAYMPVPRCETCKHWERGVFEDSKEPSHGGTCFNPELQAFGGGQTIETGEVFGCVQWEAK